MNPQELDKSDVKRKDSQLSISLLSEKLKPKQLKRRNASPQIEVSEEIRN